MAELVKLWESQVQLKEAKIPRKENTTNIEQQAPPDYLRVAAILEECSEHTAQQLRKIEEKEDRRYKESQNI
ncbi:hypothetical protein D9619_009849 [Psilocybe cf. subviscida]|uniref:Uncharacterized protein n=1 Tax=Psilocybe cf. subviscida TaxID=2480587 RepID=A0A8H5BNB0_9AGAR|nr:hypothetical protein D9619_009849 [Psilocybe cf. subviscida]